MGHAVEARRQWRCTQSLGCCSHLMEPWEEAYLRLPATLDWFEDTKAATEIIIPMPAYTVETGAIQCCEVVLADTVERFCHRLLLVPPASLSLVDEDTSSHLVSAWLGLRLRLHSMVLLHRAWNKKGTPRCLE